MFPSDTINGSKGGLPKNSQMEQFSIAYIHALTSSAGYALEDPKTDYKSVDITVTRGRDAIGQDGATMPAVPDPEIKVQLKSTTQDLIHGETINYPLSIKNYNDLRSKNVRNPRILLVLILPEDPDAWITHDNNVLLNTQGYYYNLRGEPESTNGDTITINIPTSNIFTADVLHEWMNRIVNGGTI